MERSYSHQGRRDEEYQMKREARVAWHRKGFFQDDKRVERLTDILRASSQQGEWLPLLTEWATIVVPHNEFRDIVLDLPNLEDLAILWAQWREMGEPTEFLVRCFETDDELAVDTQGFDYARYKSHIDWISCNPG